MAHPAFATVGYTVPIGEKTVAQVQNAMGQNLGNAVPSGAPEYMQWPASINDQLTVSSDGLTVRRMITFPTPPILASGQYLSPDEATLIGCLAELYTAELSAFCGTPVTALPVVLFDDPVTILGLQLGSWWTSVQFGNSGAGFPVAGPPNNTPWASVTGIGPGTDLVQAAGAQQFVLGAANNLLNNVQPAVADGVNDFMATAALPALAQPFSVMCIGQAAAAAVGYWTAGLAAAQGCDIRQTGANYQFSTDNFVNTVAGPPKDGESHLFVGTANGANSSLWVDDTQYLGDAGLGSPTGLTVMADATGAANFLAGNPVDYIRGVSGVAFTDAQIAQLYAYAQGRYGVGYF